MRCIATVAVGAVALSTSASAQDGRLKPALTACMTQAVTHPLPQMQGRNICTLTIDATAPFAKQVR
jgi:hypothetical protein